ncbi:MAG: substrate-binding domain-containing protein [Treponema sp.]|jgi:D-xylose transport system substrate-binding protein|nr:substrate-binding domain-containing protein [Treponema sp.]
MKRALVIIVICFLGFSCGRESSGAAPGFQNGQGPMSRGYVLPDEGQNRRLTVGFSGATGTFIVERWNKDLKVFSGAAQELGADVTVQLSAGGIREQIAQINYMVNQNIDVLVVLAHDTELIAGAIRQVREAGIPVVAYDRLIQGVPVEAYVSFDSKEVGRHYGRALSRAVPRGRYLVVNGSRNDVNSFDISEGLHEIIDPYIASGAVRLVKEIWLEEWSFDEALEKIDAIFRETTDFDAIACGNDSIASAAIQLLSERRLAGQIAIVGQDAELISCQRVVEGTQLMTVYKPIGTLAVRAAQVAVAIAKDGNKPPSDMLLDNHSGAMIPAYLEKTTAVYKDNIDVVIRDGFHSREDVYRNAGMVP